MTESISKIPKMDKNIQQINTFNAKKAVQAINYIVKNSDKKYKTEIIKLLFLSDRSHFRKYGSTITGDTYKAQPYGPVTIETKNMIDSIADGEDNSAISDFLEIKRDIEDSTKIEVRSRGDVNKKYLSKTNLEVLEEILDKYGSKTRQELIDFTHTLPEWKELYRENKTWRKIQLENFIDKYIDKDDKVSEYAKDIISS